MQNQFKSFPFFFILFLGNIAICDQILCDRITANWSVEYICLYLVYVAQNSLWSDTLLGGWEHEWSNRFLHSRHNNKYWLLKLFQKRFHISISVLVWSMQFFIFQRMLGNPKGAVASEPIRTVIILWTILCSGSGGIRGSIKENCITS